MAVCGLGAIAYLLFKGVATADTLSGFLMAWGNTYGLLLIVLLMGHGLVEVPRQLWLISFPERQLQLLYFRATQIDVQLHDAVYDLEDAEKELERLQRAAQTTSNSVSRDQAKIELHLAAIQQTRDGFDVAAQGGDRAARVRTPVSITMSPTGKKSHRKGTLGELVTLHSRLRMGQEKVVAGRQQWDDLMRNVALVEMIISKQLPRPASVTTGPGSSAPRRFWTFVKLKVRVLLCMFEIQTCRSHLS